MSTAAPNPSMVRVWDPFVRAFHWSLVAIFALAWLTPRLSETMHAGLGYAAIALVVARTVWGFIGSRRARFSDFVRAPRVVVAYLRAIAGGSEARHLGHNPAGGAMIVALLIGASACGVSGWLLTTDAFWGSEAAASAHSLVVHGVLALIVAHVVGVAVASYRHRENLPLAMVTGDKRAPEPPDVE